MYGDVTVKISIIYSSNTGNTKKVAEAIKAEIEFENIVYFGNVNEEIPDADIYIIGSWTDKGNASADIVEFIKKLKDKKIAYFGTAGYGGSAEYYRELFERVKANIDASNLVLGYFYCQGKMPVRVKERYMQMLAQNPKDEKLNMSVKNFDQALSHPDKEDLKNVRQWIKNIIKSDNQE